MHRQPSRDRSPRATRLASVDPASLRLAALCVALESGTGRRRDACAQELSRRARAGEDVSVAAELLESHDPDVRRRGCEALASARTLADPEPLVEALRSDDDRGVRTLAAHALGRHRVRRPRAAVALLAAAADPEPLLRVTALSALAVTVPSPAVARALGIMLVSDRFSVARAAHDTLAFATSVTIDAAAELLDASDGLVKRAGLAVVHATGAPSDALVERAMRLTLPGNDTYVRRAALQVLGHVARPSRELRDWLSSLSSDWDPTMLVTAAVVLGQLSTRAEALRPSFAAAVRRVGSDELADLASALRSAGEPAPPHGPLLARMATAAGFAQLDLADALMAPHAACEPPRGCRREGVRLPLPGPRLDDAVENVREADRPRMAAEFLKITEQEHPAVRASAAVFAAHLDYGIGTAMVLQRMADSDPDPGTQAVARGLLDAVRAGREV